jgi:BASS family bile acid:Na+ symporter
MNQDLVLAIALPLTLFCIMFSMGTGLSVEDFKRVIRAPWPVFAGLMSQMLLLPTLAYFLFMPMRLDPEIFAGFMILALSPGGTTSNMFSYLAKGNLALSISLTAIVSLITPFSIPLVGGWLLAEHLQSTGQIQFPFMQTFAKLAVVTFVPVSLGMLLRHYRQLFCIRHEFWITRIPLLMLLLVIAGIIYQNWAKMPYFMEQTGAPALLLASLALAAGYAFARLLHLQRRDARTIGIETSIQNGGTAILVTGTILHNPAMTIAPVMYGILMLVPVFSYLLWLTRYRLQEA